MQQENIKIEFVNLNKHINKIKKQLYTRDYYSKATYYRLLIPQIYPQYKKAIYIDADIVILDDIANLYQIDIKDNLIGGVTDGAIRNFSALKDYVERVVGEKDWHYYFNAGVILMNLEELRKFKFQDKFLYLLENVKFTVAQDQDYLNRLCKGRVELIDSNWDVMPCNSKNHQDEHKLKIVHYNLGDKPWHHDNVPFGDYFWKYAEKTEFYKEILKEKENYTDEQRAKDAKITESLIELAKFESDCVGDDRDLEEKKWEVTALKWLKEKFKK